MKIHLLALATVSCLAVVAEAAGPGRQNDFDGRRVLIIGIDGCRRDVMEQSIKDGRAPHFAKIAAGARAYWNMEAGGEPTGARNQPTISGPGWSTLFTGVFANKHGVLGNGEKFVAGNFTDYPHYFRYLRQAKPNAWLGSVVGITWPEVNKILIRASGENLANCLTISPSENVMEGEAKRQLTDGNVAAEAVRLLREENPDVLFLHFLDVDHVGHQFGFGPVVPQYADTLKKLDESVGTVIDALQKRPQFKDESWLIAVVTDHGGIKKGHGGQSLEERQIFAFFNGPGFRPEEMRTDQVFQSLVAPTVLNYLGVPIDPAWGFESVPVKLEK
jgi:predicted AlkP superfamily pyrophosphatase or phosphodiesterase